MMQLRTILQKYPLHTLLLIPFLSIFLFANNVESIAFFMLKRTLIFGFVLTIILLGIFYLIFFKNIVKSAVLTSIILILFFNYGIIYDYLEGLYYKGYWPFKNIHRYLFILYLCIYLLLIILFLRTKRKFISVNYAFNLIILLLTFWNSILLIYRLNNLDITNKETGFNYSIERNDTILHKPDIYFIVLDGYANQNVLKKYYNFDNSFFLNFLRNNNFHVLDSCFSNYYNTSLSLSSTLNIKYFSNDEILQPHLVMNQLRNNKVFREFKNNGYKIIQLKSGYSVTSYFNDTDSIIEINAPNEFERAILKFTMFRLDDILGQIPYLRLKSQFDILNNWEVSKNKPSFNFIHIVCPHPPYVFNSNGERCYKSNFTDNSWEPKENYIEQLSFVNKQVEKFISNILSQYKNSNSEPVIILLSDHGPYLRMTNKEDVFETRSKILFAIKTPGLNKIPDFKTSVNTFPYIFNNYFNYNIEYLNDSLAGENFFKNSTLFKNLIN